MTPEPPRRLLGPTSPSPAMQRVHAAVAIILGLAALIFYRSIMALFPISPMWAVFVGLAGFWLAVVDVAATSLRGRELRTASFMIVSVGGGVTITAIALAPFTG